MTDTPPLPTIDLTALAKRVTDKPIEERAHEILGSFHYETFRAAVCYGRDDWPSSDEEWRDLDLSIDSVAVGEHYEGWATETIDAFSRLNAAHLAAELKRLFGPVVEALEKIASNHPDGHPAYDDVEAMLLARQALADLEQLEVK